MTVTFDQLCKSGGFKGAYIFHIAGYPFAYTNKKALIDLMASPAHSADNAAGNLREQLFGTAGVSGHYLCDDVKILHLLDNNIGSQSITYDEKKAINIGSWGVKIARAETGVTFPVNTELECWGLPGLDCQLDIDSTNVITGILAEDFASSGGTLKWTVDTGLGAKIQAKHAAGEPYIMWLNSNCLATVSTATQTGNEWSCTVTDQVWNTPTEFIYRDTTHDSELIELMNAPPPIVGMTARLFLIPLDDDDNIIDATSTTVPKPILLRTGLVTNGTGGDATSWNVKVSGLTDQLKMKVPVRRWSGSLRGFSFNRCTSAGDNYQPAHIYIREYDATTATKTETALYVGGIGTGTYKRFETIEDLKQDILLQINGSAVAFDYTLIDGELCYINATGNNITVFMSGIAAYICGWGYIHPSQIELYNADNTTPIPSWAIPNNEVDVDFCQNCTYSTYIREKDAYNGVDVFKFAQSDASESIGLKNKTTCTYFYEWDYANGAVNETQQPGLQGYTKWFVPADNSSNRKMYTTAQTDCKLLSGTFEITLGSKDSKYEKTAASIYASALPHTDNTLCKATVDGTPATVDSFEVTSDQFLEVGEAYLGMSLFWMPNFKEEDPWKLADSQFVYADNPAIIFEKLLGSKDAALALPVRSIITHICDLFDGTSGDYDYQLIDWDALNELIQGAGYDGMTYGLDMAKAGSISILEALNSVCLTHGIRMTYEYQEAQRAFLISFIKFGQISAATASNEGRIIDDTSIMPKSPQDVFNNQKLYSGVLLKMKNSSGTDVAYDFDNKIGRAQAGAAGSMLSITDVITISPEQYGDSFKELSKKFANYLRIFSSPVTDQQLSTSLKTLSNIGVGRTTVMTWAAMLNPALGNRGLANKPARVMRANINLGSKGARIDYDMRISKRKNRGLAPSLILEAANIVQSGVTLTLGGVTPMNTDPANNLFGNPLSGLPDFAYFGCWYYNNSTGVITKKACSCGDYKVIIFERGTSTLADTGGSRNFWYADYVQPTSTNIGAGTGTITLSDSTNFATVLATGVDFVVEFQDSEAVVSCQHQLYCFWGDDVGIWPDPDGVDNKTFLG